MGNLLVISSSILLAVSTVFAHHITKEINSLVIVFYSFSIAFIFFNLIDANNTKPLLKLLKQNIWLVVFINVSTTVDWLFIFLALKYVSAALINCFVFGIAPIGVLLLSYKGYKSKKILLQDIMVSLLILLSLFALSCVYNGANFSLDFIFNQRFIIGLTLSFLSGIATGFTIYGCKRLQEYSFSTIFIMRVRFVIIIITTFILIALNHVTFDLQKSQLINIILLACIFVIVPTFLLQKGIELTSPIITAIITSLVPVLTYLFQLCEPGFFFHWNEMFIILIVSAIVLASTTLNRNKIR